MRLAPIVSSIPAVTPAPAAPASNKAFDEAVMHLDWAHETAGSAVSEPEYADVSTLLAASEDARTAAELLTSISNTSAAEHARDAANELETAALAVRDEEPEVATEVVRARGEDAETAIHDAFTAMGLDGRGE